MTLPAPYEFLPLTAEHKRAAIELDTWAFPNSQDTSDLMNLDFYLPWDRTVGVVERTNGGVDNPHPVESGTSQPELVGMRSSYEYAAFQAPGAEIPAAGLTWVGVHPGHRRRGILRAMIADHFDHCARRGETISALFAAEAGIYPRFGYGSAARHWDGQFPRGAELRATPGSSEHIVRFDRGKHQELLVDLHLAAARNPTGLPEQPDSRLNRPGSATPSRAEHAHNTLADPSSYRGGKEARRVVIAERDGQVRALATFRREEGWEVTGPNATVEAGFVVALDAAAAHAIWTALLNMDLTTNIKVSGLPLDDPILTLLVNPRSAAPVSHDNVWVRLIDAPAALRQRRFSADLDVVLGLTDPMLPANAGTWHLRASAFDAVEVTRTSHAPDLVLDTSVLATAYLGGVSLASLAAAGLVTQTRPGALLEASAAFAWPIAPGTTWRF